MCHSHPHLSGRQSERRFPTRLNLARRYRGLEKLSDRFLPCEPKLLSIVSASEAGGHYQHCKTPSVPGQSARWLSDPTVSVGSTQALVSHERQEHSTTEENDYDTFLCSPTVRSPTDAPHDTGSGLRGPRSRYRNAGHCKSLKVASGIRNVGYDSRRRPTGFEILPWRPGPRSIAALVHRAPADSLAATRRGFLAIRVTVT
jgi:hypothetical protein